MGAGRLDRFIQIQRYTEVDDGFGLSKVWADHGAPIHAEKTDVSDGERWRASEVSASITTRFVVRYSTFTADISPKDRLTCEGETYEIVGKKEGKGRRRWLEITAAARSDD